MKPDIFYGWYIVGVSFLSYIAQSFALSSTLSVFLKPLTHDLGVSRGIFSLVRTGEVLIFAALSPTIGHLVDHHGPRVPMALGALVASVGFLLLSQVQSFWYFALIRWLPLTIGDAFMGYLVVNVTLSRWFIRKRGRVIALANLGTGVTKISVPLVAASLFVWIGWRYTWAVFGILTLLLIVGPAWVFMRRRPEDMGLHPYGAAEPYYSGTSSGSDSGLSATQRQALQADVVWTRGEALRTSTFWLLVITFGIASVGVTGMNLHAFAYVTDIGYPTIIAASVMSVMAFTQVCSNLFWGFVAERIDLRKAAAVQFLVQAGGLALAISTNDLALVYVGFFFYGTGLGGSFVLRETIWPNYFGRLSLGTVRGMGLLITLILSAGGAPFFGFLFDATSSYLTPFTIFIGALLLSTILISLVRPPKKPGAAA